MALIALLTDFGLTDTYVAQMHAAIFGVCPECRVIDLTHAVEPQHVEHGAYLLWTTVGHLPPGAIVVAVVDPGVGSARDIVAISAAHGALRFVGPDNGLFGFLRPDFPGRPTTLTNAKIAFGDDLVTVKVTHPKWFGPSRSHTFHGRDIISPVAAHLARGVELRALGPMHGNWPRACAELWPKIDDDSTPTERTIFGTVLHTDRFGNALTNISEAVLPRLAPSPQARHIPPSVAPYRLVLDGKTDTPITGPSRTFSDVPPGTAVSYVGSGGFVEVAVNRGSAAASLGLRVGHSVTLSAPRITSG